MTTIGYVDNSDGNYCKNKIENGGGYLHGHPSWFGPTATVLLSQQHPNVGLNNWHVVGSTSSSKREKEEKYKENWHHNTREWELLSALRAQQVSGGIDHGAKTSK